MCISCHNQGQISDLEGPSLHQSKYSYVLLLFFSILFFTETHLPTRKLTHSRTSLLPDLFNRIYNQSGCIRKILLFCQRSSMVLKEKPIVAYVNTMQMVAY